MSTSVTTPTTSPNNQTQAFRPRVWLVAGGRTPDPRPGELPIVRDDLMHVWRPGTDGLMHMVAGNHDHHASWSELRTRYDLVEMCEGIQRQTELVDTLPAAANGGSHE